MTGSTQPPEITPDTTAPAEHERFAEYLHALAMVSDAEETALVAAVLGDPDQVMAQSAVVRHLDARAATLHRDPEFCTWARRMAAAVDLHPFAAQRLREWSLISAIALNAAWGPHELVAASDWSQRKVAESTTSFEALAILAQSGRTRRVRNTASARSLRGNSARSE
ncbi:hypothetical protein OH809_43915 (plasmid) [Streptomyces sp. NBC_00873]|uniref:hypothetical protein n=1 Tax=unclassified Streptomyces TaxID=2593676 RepID=UPI002F90DEBA|nr:hypothetical protein OH809_43915 [Streptomyces sp. NBC_00873]WTA49174.1 hypothetical protein OH821_44580 [Streptomyces sp. NBC_00842]